MTSQVASLCTKRQSSASKSIYSSRNGERIPERVQMVNPKDDLSLADRMRWMYFQFSLATCTYMLDPWERHLADACFLAVFAIFTYSCYVYLPHYAMHVVHLLTRVFTTSKLGS